MTEMAEIIFRKRRRFVPQKEQKFFSLRKWFSLSQISQITQILAAEQHFCYFCYFCGTIKKYFYGNLTS